ncbi:HAD-IIA family hydrolase [Candidatus Micrarchaeota archaeon]|nr:HAD-IIA family hydrolase [Candidatus Micrarchaeota archaeon]
MAIKNVIFDMDGVMYVGRTAVPGAAETVAYLRGKGVNVFFLTNNAEKMREEFTQKLNSFGIEAKDGEVYSSGYGAARYVKETYPGKTVFAFSNGTKAEMQRQGIELDLSGKAQVVVAGLDLQINYEKLVAAFRAIMGGAEFIATNEDMAFPVEDGLKPGAGLIVAGLAASTGRKPVNVGKPEPYLLDIILKEHGLSKEETLMVGDRLETDILMAKREGVKSMLVLSGVSCEKDAKEKGLIPDYIVESVAEIPKMGII